MGTHPPVVLYTESPGRVLTLLQVSEQSGVLTFAPTALLEHASWLALCELRQGHLMTCQVTRRIDGGQLMGPEALKWVQDHQAFWHFRAQRQTGASASRIEDLAPTIALDVKPRHTVSGKAMPVLLLAREQRVVFLLLNGHRSKADLLRLLPALREEQLDQMLTNFVQRGLIEL